MSLTGAGMEGSESRRPEANRGAGPSSALEFKEPKEESADLKERELEKERDRLRQRLLQLKKQREEEKKGVGADALGAKGMPGGFDAVKGASGPDRKDDILTGRGKGENSAQVSDLREVLQRNRQRGQQHSVASPGDSKPPVIRVSIQEPRRDPTESLGGEGRALDGGGSSRKLQTEVSALVAGVGEEKKPEIYSKGSEGAGSLRSSPFTDSSRLESYKSPVRTSLETDASVGKALPGLESSTAPKPESRQGYIARGPESIEEGGLRAKSNKATDWDRTRDWKTSGYRGSDGGRQRDKGGDDSRFAVRASEKERIQGREVELGRHSAREAKIGPGGTSGEEERHIISDGARPPSRSGREDRAERAEFVGMRIPYQKDPSRGERIRSSSAPVSGRQSPVAQRDGRFDEMALPGPPPLPPPPPRPGRGLPRSDARTEGFRSSGEGEFRAEKRQDSTQYSQRSQHAGREAATLPGQRSTSKDRSIETRDTGVPVKLPKGLAWADLEEGAVEGDEESGGLPVREGVGEARQLVTEEGKHSREVEEGRESRDGAGSEDMEEGEFSGERGNVGGGKIPESLNLLDGGGGIQVEDPAAVTSQCIPEAEAGELEGRSMDSNGETEDDDEQDGDRLSFEAHDVTSDEDEDMRDVQESKSVPAVGDEQGPSQGQRQSRAHDDDKGDSVSPELKPGLERAREGLVSRSKVEQRRGEVDSFPQAGVGQGGGGVDVPEERMEEQRTSVGVREDRRGKQVEPGEGRSRFLESPEKKEKGISMPRRSHSTECRRKTEKNPSIKVGSSPEEETSDHEYPEPLVVAAEAKAEDRRDRRDRALSEEIVELGSKRRHLERKGSGKASGYDDLQGRGESRVDFGKGSRESLPRAPSYPLSLGETGSRAKDEVQTATMRDRDGDKAHVTTKERISECDDPALKLLRADGETDERESRGRRRFPEERNHPLDKSPEESSLIARDSRRRVDDEGRADDELKERDTQERKGRSSDRGTISSRGSQMLLNKEGYPDAEADERATKERRGRSPEGGGFRPRGSQSTGEKDSHSDAEVEERGPREKGGGKSSDRAPVTTRGLPRSGDRNADAEVGAKGSGSRERKGKSQERGTFRSRGSQRSVDRDAEAEVEADERSWRERRGKTPDGGGVSSRPSQRNVEKEGHADVGAKGRDWRERSGSRRSADKGGPVDAQRRGWKDRDYSRGGQESLGSRKRGEPEGGHKEAEWHGRERDGQREGKKSFKDKQWHDDKERKLDGRKSMSPEGASVGAAVLEGISPGHGGERRKGGWRQEGRRSASDDAEIHGEKGEGGDKGQRLNKEQRGDKRYRGSEAVQGVLERPSPVGEEREDAVDTGSPEAKKQKQREGGRPGEDENAAAEGTNEEPSAEGGGEAMGGGADEGNPRQGQETVAEKSPAEGSVESEGSDGEKSGMPVGTGGGAKLRSRWLEDEEEEEHGRDSGASAREKESSEDGATITKSTRREDVANGTGKRDGPSGSSSDGGGADSDEGTDEEDGTLGAMHPALRSILQGCRSVDEFDRLDVLGEGVYGVVHRAKDKATGETYALKRVKLEKEREGFPLTSLREINILLSLDHPAIVGVKEVVVNRSMDRVFMVMEYVEHELKVLLESMKHPFALSEVKCLMLQLLQGLAYMHRSWVLHRDIKTSNLLFNNRGQVKFCDFGLARQYGQPLRAYTQPVVTLWYRAPELLLGQKEYSTAVDVWSMGCVMAELLMKKPLFKGENDLEQIHKIFAELGTPTAESWPQFASLPACQKVKFTGSPVGKLRDKFPVISMSGRPSLSEAGYDLLCAMLTMDPSKRITAEDAVNHPWFKEQPLPKAQEAMPTFPVLSEAERKRRRAMRSPDPFKELQRQERLRAKQGGQTSLFGP